MFREALKEALRRNDQSAAASFLNSSGGAQFALFHYRRALQSFREAHRLALQTGNGELVVMSSLNLSTLYLQQNDLNSALRAFSTHVPANSVLRSSFWVNRPRMPIAAGIPRHAGKY